MQGREISSEGEVRSSQEDEGREEEGRINFQACCIFQAQYHKMFSVPHLSIDLYITAVRA